MVAIIRKLKLITGTPNKSNEGNSVTDADRKISEFAINTFKKNYQKKTLKTSCYNHPIIQPKDLDRLIPIDLDSEWNAMEVVWLLTGEVFKAGSLWRVHQDGRKVSYRLSTGQYNAVRPLTAIKAKQEFAFISFISRSSYDRKLPQPTSKTNQDNMITNDDL